MHQRGVEVHFVPADENCLPSRARAARCVCLYLLNAAPNAVSVCLVEFFTQRLRAFGAEVEPLVNCRNATLSGACSTGSSNKGSG